MASSSSPPTPEVHILDKSDYSKQHVIALPGAYPLPPLGPNSVRIQTRMLCVTINNFTYAVIGHVFGYWNLWTTPAPSLPEPYNDTDKYGRLSSWGYAEIIESTKPEFPVGTYLWGYVPMATLPEDLEVAVGNVPSHCLEVSKRRDTPFFQFYNRYLTYAPDQLPKDTTSLRLDSLLKVFFETSYLMNRFVFSPTGTDAVHPLGASIPWTAEAADLTDNVVVLLSASSKTGLAFAHQLRHARPADKQPRKVIAVGSERSRAFSKATGFFDDVLLYDDAATDTAPELAQKLGGVDKTTTVRLVNFAGRNGADAKWAAALGAISDRLTSFLVGRDPKATAPSPLAPSPDGDNGVFQILAPGLRAHVIAREGDAAYYDQLHAAWESFKAGGAIPGLKIQSGAGLESLKQGWEDLSNGKVGPDVGLVYDL